LVGTVRPIVASPYVLQHAGLLAGAAIVTGTGGTILFGLVGLAASIPLSLRLKRRLRSWRDPATALIIFAAVFALSSLIISLRLVHRHGARGHCHPARRAPRS
jgi:hypothetical protein